MASIEDAIATVFKHEGGYVNDERDSGGATNFGISTRFLEELSKDERDELSHAGVSFVYPITVEQIQAITKPKAQIIYKLFFWQPYNYSEINNIDIATKVFDVGVDMGSKTANKCLQHAVRAAIGTVLVDDGVLGPLSISTINKVDNEVLLGCLKSELAGQYRKIAAVRPTMNYAISGWLNRAYSNRITE